MTWLFDRQHSLFVLSLFSLSFDADWDGVLGSSSSSVGALFVCLTNAS
jgi:hypothetical protein